MLTDGTPFALSLDNLVKNSQVFAPVNCNENANEIPDTFPGNYYYTGTYADGTAASTNCANWTSNDGSNFSGVYGSKTGASAHWTEAGGISCNASLRLLCFQTGTGGPLPSLTVPAGAKRVFVTSTTHTGNLGGLSGADTVCQLRATEASLPNASNYKAWLSTSSFHAKDRLTSNGPWYRLDNVKIADSKTDLTDGKIFTAISQTQTGAYINSAYFEVWTGTTTDGQVGLNNCNDWFTDDSYYSGLVGYGNESGSMWTSATFRVCNNSRALYCFED